jgi:hypothetical protein
MNAGGLALQYRYTHFVLKKNLANTTHEESLSRPEPGGNCLNWVLGHILLNRNDAHRLLGLEPVWTEAEGSPYQRGASGLDPAGPGVRELETMIADLDRSQEQIQAALVTATDERLLQQEGDGTVGDLLYGLTFHEAYHAGQTGILRRLAGKEGTLR